MTAPQKVHIRPNSFSSPNEYVDEAMEMLSSDEYKVLSFVVRHTWGWQIDQKAISLNMFLNGYSRYHGVGLSRATVIKCLSELSRLKFLIPVGKADADGQVWAIGRKPDLKALEQRYLESKSKRQDQMSPVRAKRTQKVVYDTDQHSMTQTESDLQHRPPAVYDTDTIKDTLKSQHKTKESAVSGDTDSRSGDDSLIANARTIVRDAFAVNESVKAAEPDSKPADSKSPQKLLTRPQTKAAASSPAAPPKPLMAAVCYAMNESPGPMPGMIGKFFSGTLDKKDKKDTAWTNCQPDPSPTPEQLPLQIIAFTLWYSKHDKYKSSFAEHKALPMTPRILRERWDIYMARDDTTHAYWMAQARPILERLLRGEKVSPAAPLSTGSTGRVESAQAYKPIKPGLDPAYLDRRQAGDLEFAARLFGANS